jgi:hypothetical protein
MKKSAPAKSSFSSLRQLHEDAQHLANELLVQHRGKWAPRVDHVDQMRLIALKLKRLEMDRNTDLSTVELTESVGRRSKKSIS